MFKISRSLKSKAEFSQKLFYQSFLATFTTKVLLKNFIQKALFFNYAITFSQVQADVSIDYRFCFCFYSYDRKNKSYYAKASLVALKGKERAYLSNYSGDPMKS